MAQSPPPPLLLPPPGPVEPTPVSVVPPGGLPVLSAEVPLCDEAVPPVGDDVPLGAVVPVVPPVSVPVSVPPAVADPTSLAFGPQPETSANAVAARERFQRRDRAVFMIGLVGRTRHGHASDEPRPRCATASSITAVGGSSSIAAGQQCPSPFDTSPLVNPRPAAWARVGAALLAGPEPSTSERAVLIEVVSSERDSGLGRRRARVGLGSSATGPRRAPPGRMVARWDLAYSAHVSSTPRPINRRWSALVGFIGHAPGLKLLVPCTFSSRLVGANVIAVVATVAAMLIAWFVAPEGSGWWWLFIAWVVGHFCWSSVLATWILLGRGLSPKE